ncbi:esterase-like activity of phytase family protein [Neoroseomonas lacus]|uniref:esterase-like activity of phytase family protein n=1 Tax=Neoroseomonas lacus TaxID=287609 RepID=UPI00166BBFB3|nr:esterase-like activity of phytase family protein [Neoroseomonas lacus]
MPWKRLHHQTWRSCARPPVSGETGQGKGLSRRAALAAALATTGCLHPYPTPPAGGAANALPPLPLAGPLRSLGGLDIDNANLGAGGLSGLYLDDGLVATFVDDRTRWAQARLVLRDGLPAGLAPIASGPLNDGGGRPLPGGFGGDAEALTRLPDGTWLVAFERWHRIRAYRRLDDAGLYVEAPTGLDRAPANGGLESLALLADGRLLAIAEDLQPTGSPSLRQGWVGGPGLWAPLTYRPAEGFVPVDATGLPDGGALVLERRFRWYSGFSGRLVRLPAGAMRPGAVLEGQEILRIDGNPVPAENFEGVTARRHDGRTLVAIVADDNHMPNQRSLMLLFELAG